MSEGGFMFALVSQRLPFGSERWARKERAGWQDLGKIGKGGGGGLDQLSDGQGKIGWGG